MRLRRSTTMPAPAAGLTTAGSVTRKTLCLTSRGRRREMARYSLSAGARRRTWPARLAVGAVSAAVAAQVVLVVPGADAREASTDTTVTPSITASCFGSTREINRWSANPIGDPQWCYQVQVLARERTCFTSRRAAEAWSRNQVGDPQPCLIARSQ